MLIVDDQIATRGCFVSISLHVCRVRFNSLRQTGHPPPMPFAGVGLVDTGASNSVVDHTVIAALGLKPTGTTRARTVSTGSTPILVNEYDVSVWFPHPISVVQSQPSIHPIHQTLPVTEADFSARGFPVLIGRDILARGLFIYNGLSGRFTLAF